MTTIQPLIGPRDPSVAISVQQRSPLSPENAFRIITPIDLTRVYPRLPGVPVLLGVTGQTGEWDHVGASRHPQFSDGSTAFEQMTEYVPGRSFAYQLTNLTNAMRRLVVGFRGEWTFTPDGTGTLVRWTYEFKPLPGRRWIVAGPLSAGWRTFMRRGMANIVSEANRLAAQEPMR